MRRRTTEVMEELDDALRGAGIRPDEPMAPVLGAWKRGLAWQGELAAQTALSAADMRGQLADFAAAARQPMSDQDRAEMLRVLGVTVKREVWMRERKHILRTAGAMAIALLITAGGCYVWGRTSASLSVFVAGTDARAGCDVSQEQTVNGEKLCPVWLNLSQVGAVPVPGAGRK